MSNSGKILQRFFKQSKYSDDDWQNLNTLFQENESWKIICATYNIKHSYYKALKKYFNENGSIY